jgi:hypothetical protein
MFNPIAKQHICCPNCGSRHADRHLLDGQILRTQCPDCDYLLISCAVTARVIESYAPTYHTVEPSYQPIRSALQAAPALAKEARN